jgi:hypothetical protein
MITFVTTNLFTSATKWPFGQVETNNTYKISKESFGKFMNSRIGALFSLVSNK